MLILRLKDVNSGSVKRTLKDLMINNAMAEAFCTRDAPTFSSRAFTPNCKISKTTFQARNIIAKTT